MASRLALCIIWLLVVCAQSTYAGHARHPHERSRNSTAFGRHQRTDTLATQAQRMPELRPVGPCLLPGLGRLCGVTRARLVVMMAAAGRMNRTLPAVPFAAIAGVAALLAYVRARLRRGHRREDARLEDGAGWNSFENSLPSRLEILAHYWSCPRLTLRAPVGALKGWVLATLWLELALFTAPELCVLAVPEVVELYSGVLPYRQDKPDLPHLVEWLLPGMASASVHGSTSMGDWMGGPPSPLVASRVTWLRCVRQALLVGWILFLLIPLSDWPRAATAAFATGAAAYFLLGTIGLLYDPCHNIQADAPNVRDRGHCALSVCARESRS